MFGRKQEEIDRQERIRELKAQAKDYQGTPWKDIAARRAVSIEKLKLEVSDLRPLNTYKVTIQGDGEYFTVRAHTHGRSEGGLASFYRGDVLVATFANVAAVLLED